MNANPLSLTYKPDGAVLRIVMISLAVLLAGCTASVAPVDTIPISGNFATALPAVPATSTVTQAASAATSGSAASSASENSNVKQEILNAMGAFEKAGPYKAHTTVTAGSRTYESLAEVILPDRFHIVSSDQEMLIIGQKSYIKQNGKWISYAVDVSGVVAGLRGSLRNDLVNGMQDEKVAGVEKVNGKLATVYRFTEAIADSGQQFTNSIKLWVDQERGLPVRQEIDGTANGVKTVTVQTIQYDPGITIQDPNK